jgi:hypothetical protein
VAGARYVRKYFEKLSYLEGDTNSHEANSANRSTAISYGTASRLRYKLPIRESGPAGYVLRSSPDPDPS